MTTVLIVLLIVCSVLLLIALLPQPVVVPTPRRYYIGRDPRDTNAGEIFLPCYHRKTADLIMHYAMIAESRQTGRCTGADIFLRCQDGFDPRREFDYDEMLNFYWLVKHGHKTGVHVTGKFIPADFELGF